MDVVAIGDNISDCYVAIGQVFPGGNAVNVSVAAARSGGRSAYIGAVGDDRRGQLLIDSLTAESVDVGRLRVVPGQTACCEVLHADGERQFGTTNRGVALFTPTLDDLAFAATADRPSAVLTGPSVIAGSRSRLIQLSRPATTHGMVRVNLEHRRLAATAALVWSGDLSRTLQQILFDTAESIISPGPVRQAEPELKAMSLSATHLGQAPPGGRGSGT